MNLQSKFQVDTLSSFKAMVQAHKITKSKFKGNNLKN